MTITRSRSMSAELREGATDGRYVKAYPNWSGGLPSNRSRTVEDKSLLADRMYGPQETPEAVRRAPGIDA